MGPRLNYFRSNERGEIKEKMAEAQGRQHMRAIKIKTTQKEATVALENNLIIKNTPKLFFSPRRKTNYKMFSSSYDINGAGSKY